MIFSYYFDRAKQHRIEFIFQMLDQQVEADGDMAVLFNARIREIKDGLELRNEFKLGNFTFAANNSAHDIDFHRIHISEQRKWLFEVKNNKQVDQSVVVGIIAKELNGNPIGMDIFQTSESYEAALRANNLAVVEDTYAPPEITQTIVFTIFDTPEMPIGFLSTTSVYITSQKHYEIKEFIHALPEVIKENTKFSIDMNLAPLFVDPKRDAIFDLTIEGIGTITLQKSYLVFLKRDSDPSFAVRVPFTVPFTPEMFYNNGFTSASKLEVRGDGKGLLTVKYADKQFSANYLPDRPITYLDMISSERADALTSAAFANKYTGDLMTKGEIIATGSRASIADEWVKENVADGSSVTAWASDVTGVDADGVAGIGIRYDKPRMIKKITFRQSTGYGSDHISIKAFNDGIPSEEVTTRATLSQDYVEIEIEQDVTAQNWMIVSETPIVSFPDDGRTTEERAVNESWIVYDLQMMEAAPNAVLNVKHVIGEEGNVVVSWDYSDLTDVTFSLYNHGVDTGYEIAGQKSITMVGLEREVEHAITVVATREGFDSFESELISFVIGERLIDWSKVIPVKLDNMSIKIHQ